MRSWIAGAVGVGLVGLAVAGCNENNHYPGDGGTTATADDTNPGDVPQALPPAFGVALEVHDEDGSPLAGATVRVDEATFTTNASGLVNLPSLDQPVLAVIESANHLPEPVALGRGDAAEVVSMTLIRRLGPGGRRRTAMHFGGDSMLGRRYTDPDENGLVRVSQLDGGAQARQVVEALAPLFKAADVRALNFESIIGELPESLAYTLKRYVIQSPSATALPALQELDPNAVNLSNNHLYDWEDPGVISTVGALQSAGIPFFGAGASEASAREPLILTLPNGIKVGFLGYTPIDGDNGNDALPTSPNAPANLSPASAWKYELRQFGFQQGSVAIADSPRVAGEVWRLFRDEEEGGLTGTVLDAFWAEVRAVYPELQDIVARRGHGGPNFFVFDRIAPDIAGLRAQGVDVVVVQLHNGYEYAEHKNPGQDYAAKLAIDNGADLFVGHHPHTLNGIEFYKGKLIANSLGNFFFDQNLFVTFTSAMLRVVFEEDQLIQARVYPITVDDYRTAPVVGAAAEQTIRTLKERSNVPVITERDDQRRVFPVFTPDAPEAAVPDYVFENNSARIVAPVGSGTAPVNSATSLAVQLDPGDVYVLEGHTLTRSRNATGGSLGLEFGRDLYHAWGSFEDLTADGIADAETHWSLNTTTHRAEAVAGAPHGFGALRMRRVQSNLGRTTTVPIARAPLLRVRYYDSVGTTYVPATDEATYSLRFDYRLRGEAPFSIRFKVYAFVDTDPFIRPSTTFVREVTLPVELIGDDEWHSAAVDIPPSAVAPEPGGGEPNFAIPILDLYPATTPEAVLLIDRFQFLQWHSAGSLPDGYYAADAVRRDGGGGGVVTLEQK